MEFVIAALILILALVLVYRMVVTGRLEWCHLGILGVFAIGHFVLPIALKPLSNLADRTTDEIVPAVLIHGLFLTSVVGGVILALGTRTRVRSLQTPTLDLWLVRHRRKVFIVSTAVYLALFFSIAQTSYAAEDFTEFFTNRNPFLAALASMQSWALGTLGICTALEVRDGRKVPARVMTATIFALVILALPTAQRLAIITPMAVMLSALLVTGQKRRAMRSAGILVLVLVVVSPFAVYLRSARSQNRSGEVVSIGRDFSYGDSQLTTMAQSLADRADLLGNTIPLKDYVDHQGFVGWRFYYSVLVSPIPRVLLGNKPYLLSADGTMWSEISVLSWSLRYGGIGSLTAFGGITAYREGGWLIVALDGVLTGALFVFVARWLGRGGIVGMGTYVTLFPLLAIKRVPPSLFEALAELLPLLPIVAVFVLTDKMLRWTRRSTVAQPVELSPSWAERTLAQ